MSNFNHYLEMVQTINPNDNTAEKNLKSQEQTKPDGAPTFWKSLKDIPSSVLAEPDANERANGVKGFVNAKGMMIEKYVNDDMLKFNALDKRLQLALKVIIANSKKI